MMEPFRSNLDVLGKRDPLLAGRVRENTAHRSWEILSSASGQVTVRKVLNEGGVRYIHSRIDPEREADQWAALLSDTTETLAVLGFGLGYPLLALRKRGYTGRLIVAESDIGLFRLAMQRVDLTPALGDPGVFWVVGEEPAVMRGAITGISPDSLSYRVFYPAADLNPEYYRSVRRILEQYIFEYRLQKDPSLSRGIGQLLSETIE